MPYECADLTATKSDRFASCSAQEQDEDEALREAEVEAEVASHRVVS